MVQVLFLSLFIWLQMPLPLKAEVAFSAYKTDAIYGVDDRKFISAKSPAKIIELSKSIAMVISKDVVQKNFFSTKILAKNLSDEDGINLCPDERFAKHHSVNSCTAFLIGEDLVASAGHCFLSEADCSSKLIAFNLLEKNETKEGYQLLSQNVFECKEIVSQVQDGETLMDYAIIRLKKKAVGRKILKLRTMGAITLRDKVFMIGHPLGLPQVITNSALVNDVSNPHFFKATLDSFEGNSGSPVFNSKTFEVEGILVRGEEDFVQDQSLQCYRDQVYDQGLQNSPSLKGEGVSRIGDILPKFKR